MNVEVSASACWAREAVRMRDEKESMSPSFEVRLT
jgi:hypothetical protein